jgi:hypothetical protein
MEMRTLDRLCAGLQDGPVHVLSKIPKYTISKAIINKQEVSEARSGNKHSSAGLRHKSAYSHS